MYTSVSKIFAFGLLVSAPLANALAIPSQSQDLARSVDSLEARHHTEAQIAASSLTLVQVQNDSNIKQAKKAKAAKGARDVVIETRHHTEAQIAAKKAKAAKAGRSVEEREPHHTEAQVSPPVLMADFPLPVIYIYYLDIG
jgi:hypothetical protein